MSKDAPFENRRNMMEPGWEHRRKRQLRKHRMCQWVHCLRKADTADHIVPRFEGGTDSDANLQSLCHYHHDLKTAEEGRRAWARKKAQFQQEWNFTESHPGLNT